MKPKTLLVLAIVTALLGAYVYFFERDLPSTDEAKALEKKVLNLEQDEVTAVTLRSGENLVRLERVAPKPEPESESESESDEGSIIKPEPEWRITAPIEARADRTEVDLLLGDLVGLEIEREIDDVDTAMAGLDEPRAEVTLATADGTSTLAVGVEVPLSSDALVRVEGGEGTRIVQTGFGESLLEKIGRDAGDWRDQRLFLERRADVRSLAWTDPDGERVVLLRRGDGETFWLESPIQDRADAEKVRGLLSSLTALEAASFVDEAESSFASFEPAGRLEVTLAERDESFLVELAAEDDTAEDDTAEDDTAEITARVDGQLVRLEPGPVVDIVGSSASDWRSLAWTDLQSFQIEEAILDQPGEELLALRRVEGDWLRATGDAARVAEGSDGETVGEEIPYTAASNVLYALTDAKAESLDDAAPSSALLLTVTLVSDDGEETLRLFPAGEGGLYAATSEGRDAVLRLSAESVDELLENVKALRDAEAIPAESPPAELVEEAEDDS